MNWKDYLNAAITAAMTGGATAALSIGFDPTHADWKRSAGVFAGGAVLGLLNHFRTPPGKISVPNL